MCGITGIVSFVNDAINPTSLEFMNNLLTHRGPDNGGVFVDRNVGLGHRRLSIIDLSKDADQPMSYQSFNYKIVFNGEIYNYIELREELVLKGYQFRTKSDTEVVLASYIEWGNDCFHKFNGMWAMAIYNTQNQDLILCRDRFGVKPLYYYIDHEKFIFASEKKAIVLSDFVDLEFDYRGIQTAIKNSFQLEGTGNTEFKNIKNLMPGHFIQIRDQKWEICRWYDLRDRLIKIIPNDFNQRVEKFKEIFQEACKIRLRSDVPLATSLSGGLDSSSVVATISSLSEFKYHAFTHSFEGTFLDEVKYAQVVSETASVPLEIIKMSEIDLGNEMDDIIYYNESIYGGIPDGAYRIYKTIKKSGYKISIDGHGADEMLAGYSWYAQRGWLIEFFKIMKGWGKRIMFCLPWKGKIYKNKSFACPSHFSRLKKRLFEDFSYTILPRILKNFDAMSMAHSVEVRMPFLDYRLVEYVFSLPDSDLINQGWTKYILRCAMEGVLDKRINWRKDKIGFNSPVEQILKDNLKSWTLRAIEQSDDFLFNKKSLKKEFDKLISSSNNWTEWLEFWNKINAIKLIEVYKKRKQHA